MCPYWIVFITLALITSQPSLAKPEFSVKYYPMSKWFTSKVALTLMPAEP